MVIYSHGFQLLWREKRLYGTGDGEFYGSDCVNYFCFLESSDAADELRRDS